MYIKSTDNDKYYNANLHYKHARKHQDSKSN